MISDYTYPLQAPLLPILPPTQEDMAAHPGAVVSLRTCVVGMTGPFTEPHHRASNQSPSINNRAPTPLSALDTLVAAITTRVQSQAYDDRPIIIARRGFQRTPHCDLSALFGQSILRKQEKKRQGRNKSHMTTTGIYLELGRGARARAFKEMLLEGFVHPSISRTSRIEELQSFP
ncbi:hypothetical protein BC832DRAFT_592519 [Gaertneriomyces semiglobifer]|nr:hypothetical protein BC832DRAFT_592519 [Gaertneriomyces semiglobifer]